MVSSRKPVAALAGPEVALVIPCYNEEKRLPAEEFVDFVRSDPQVHFVFVDDGSTDNTLKRLESLHQDFPRNIDVVSTDGNKGKAEAVRRGVLFADQSLKCGLFGYWDADLSTPLTELRRFLEVFQESKTCEFVSGARILRMGSDISRHWYRHYLGRIMATGSSMALNLPYYDTQCGAKVFRKGVVHTLFEEPFLSQWLFDIELIFRLKGAVSPDRFQFVFYEVPLTVWKDVPGSKLSIPDIFKAPYELFKIWRYYSRP